MGNRRGFGSVIFIAIALSLVMVFLLKGRDYSNFTKDVDVKILGAIKEMGIGAEDLTYERVARSSEGRNIFFRVKRRYKVGYDFDHAAFIKKVEEALDKTGFIIKKAIIERERGGISILISLSFKNRILYDLNITITEPRYRSGSAKPRKGKIAIALDDFGYNMSNLHDVLSINLPLTISILPNLAYSTEVAEEVKGHSIEVMLHLPMEPHNSELRLEENTILTGMPSEEVKKLLSEAISEIPGLKGVSNHMGSKATEDRDLMRVVFGELKKRDLYFLDNLVTDKSVCGKMAKEAGVQSASRSVFLDNKADESYIDGQMAQVEELASKTGWVIAVGHDRPATIKVLTRAMPRLREDGFEFVYVSELVK
ncbi:MAG: divergent polysaccharide deacetylase family protein [Candidatus Omnitrophica bacterium]|nr:divergent polysaccharide deacetylase family protein [Candidatus Omnitrophota bacterium]